MRVGVVVAGIPNRSSGGGALTAWSAIQALRERGDAVSVCALEGIHASASKVPRRDQVEQLERLGASVRVVEGPSTISRRDRWIRLVAPRRDRYLPTARLADEVSRWARSTGDQDAVLAYHFDALAAAIDAPVGPLFAAVGDPLHLPAYFAWRLLDPRPTPRYLRSMSIALELGARMPGEMKRMLLACAGSGAFAAHHAAWFRKIGVDGCRYLRTPVVDEGGRSWARERSARASPGRRRILLVGHFRGAATLSGLYLFARRILPVLERARGGQVEVRIVGGHTPPSDLARLLDRPNVRLLGWVPDIREEFLAADVLVVPTPIPLGIRVRILTGLSFGSCTITHRANALGIPELVHGENALLGANAREMAQLILGALDDPALRATVGDAARRTYEAAFTPEVAGSRIAAELATIAS
jgi:hypothetical protein